MNTQTQVDQKVAPSKRDDSIIDLLDLELAVVGGGCGEVVFG